MFFKKRAAIVYFILFVIYLLLIVFAFADIDRLALVSLNYCNYPCVVIDAGHGGMDGGAVDNGIVEKDLNLSIAEKLKEILLSSGFNVVMIRNSDTMIYSDGSSLRQKKVSDMKNRLKIYNSNPENIVLSIHQNKFQIKKYIGTQVFYSKNNKESSVLAECIKNSIKNLIQSDNKRQIKPAEKNIYLLYNSKVTSVIIECGFISNPAEADKLKNNSYQNKIAFAIYSGFLDYYNKRGIING